MQQIQISRYRYKFPSRNIILLSVAPSLLSVSVCVTLTQYLAYYLSLKKNNYSCKMKPQHIFAFKKLLSYK